MKIYLACGLTHVPRAEFSAYVEFLQGLAEHLTVRHGAEVKYALRDSDPQLSQQPFVDRARLCYIWDKDMVEWSDVVVAEASYPSTGLGIELQIACASELPVVIAFKLDTAHKAPSVQYQTPDHDTHSLQLGEGYVSLMALGLPNVVKVLPYQATNKAYTDIGEAVEKLRLSTPLTLL